MQIRHPIRRIFGIIALAVALSCGSGPLAAGEDDRFQPVRDRIAKALVDHNIPSIAVAVAHEGQIVWEQGFGWADRENRVPASEHTLYSLASISKPITATGLMVLVERQKIDLDKPINDYLGEAKLRARVGDAADATVRRVANHTSGLPLHYQFFYADESYRPPAARRNDPPLRQPGDCRPASTINTAIWATACSTTSSSARPARPYADFMREEVFLPLGMTHMSVDVAPGLEPHQAIRYTPEGKRIPFYEFDHPGASAVYASAHDLARFAMFHMKEHLADQRAILKDEIDRRDAKVRRPRRRRAAATASAGGSSESQRGYHVVQHTGGMPGVSPRCCTLVPDERLAIVVLSQLRRTDAAGDLSNMILKHLLPEKKSEGAKPAADPRRARTSGSFEPGSRAAGHVEGQAGHLPRASCRWSLEVKESGDVHVRVGRQLETLAQQPRLFHDGMLHGRVRRATFGHRRRPRRRRLRSCTLGASSWTATTMPTGRCTTPSRRPDAWGSNGRRRIGWTVERRARSLASKATGRRAANGGTMRTPPTCHPIDADRLARTPARRRNGCDTCQSLAVACLLAHRSRLACPHSADEPEPGGRDRGRSTSLATSSRCSRHCYECHGPNKQEGGLRLDERAAAFDGGDVGQRHRARQERREPAAHGRARHQRSTSRGCRPRASRCRPTRSHCVKRWIDQGADWPDEAAGTATGNDPRDHWAFKPPVRPRRAGQSRTPAGPPTTIDRFILARLGAEGLAAVAAGRQGDAAAPLEPGPDRPAADDRRGRRLSGRRPPQAL